MKSHSSKTQRLFTKVRESQPVLNTLATKKGNIYIPVKLSAEELVNSVRTYQAYIDEKIQKLNPTSPTYKETKTKLESCKTKAEITEVHYSSYDEFQKSPYFGSLSKQEQTAYSKDHFPKKIKAITLSFDDYNEAADYLIKHQKKEIAQVFINKIQATGLKIDPTILAKLKPDAESTVRRSLH